MKIRIPSVRPGLETEKSKQQSRIERALYRKVFMNIERTQVKENLRQREHRLRMAQLVTQCLYNLILKKISFNNFYGEEEISEIILISYFKKLIKYTV